MKITFISEDHPDGLVVDWPDVPRLGDLVSFKSRGGTNHLLVAQVNWEADALGNLLKVEVNLAY